MMAGFFPQAVLIFSMSMSTRIGFGSKYLKNDRIVDSNTETSLGRTGMTISTPLCSSVDSSLIRAILPFFD
jgi:hypothetical protein